MWKLVIEDDQGHQTTVTLVRDEYAVGRGEENSIRLTERNVSRRHLVLRSELKADPPHWWVEDQQSYNGCFVNGQRVAERAAVNHGDLVQLGDYRLELLDETVAGKAGRSGSATMPALPRNAAAAIHRDRLVQVVGPTVGAEYALSPDSVTTIGRGEECDIAINHGSVSRVHAELRPLGEGRFEIIDRESANGIRVNGIDLQRCALDARDAVELGDVVLRFVPAGILYVPSAEESQRLAALVSVPGSAERTAQTLKLLAAAAVVAAVLGLVAVLVATSSSTPAAADSAGAAKDPTSELLAAATELAKTDLEAAHNKLLSSIPESSNARLSTEFKQIEARWADSLLARARAEGDLQAKRLLLDRVARASTVDSGRRKQAADELERLNSAAAAAPAASELPPDPSASAGTDASAPAPATAVAAATKPLKPKKKSLSELLTSGDPAEQAEAKDRLKAIVNSGAGSPGQKSQLRGLCRQLGDDSCVDVE